MTRRRLRHTEYLEHVLEAIRRIRRYTRDLDRDGFERDEQVQDAVIRNLEIIGEAARRLLEEYPDVMARYPQVPWKTAYATRNRLAHGYFEIDWNVVWDTVQRSLPEFERQVQQIRDELGPPPPGATLPA